MVPLFGIYDDVVLMIARIVLGVVLVAHGWPKIKNLKKTAEGFTMMGFRPGFFWGTLVSILEFIGGLMLVFGLFTQFVAALVALQFLVIILKLNFKKGLVGGYELDLMILALALVLFALGGGEKSLDSLLRIVFFW